MWRRELAPPAPFFLSTVPHDLFSWRPERTGVQRGARRRDLSLHGKCQGSRLLRPWFPRHSAGIGGQSDGRNSRGGSRFRLKFSPYSPAATGLKTFRKERHALRNRGAGACKRLDSRLELTRRRRHHVSLRDGGRTDLTRGGAAFG